MPDARVQAAIDNWAPRLIANGVDYNDVVRTTSAIERWDEWLGGWTATADAHRTQAVEALVDDIEPAGMAHVAFVRSQHAHAAIGRVRAPANPARKPIAVLTAADLAGKVRPFPRVGSRPAG